MTSADSIPTSPRRVALPGAVDPEQAVDLFDPLGEVSSTAVALLHGGGWYGGTRESFHAWARFFADHGHPSASLGYRLGEGTTYHDKMRDVAAGLATLTAEFSDAERLVLMGSSAGAHLVTALALDTVSAWTEQPVLPLAGVISSNGPGSMLPEHLLRSQERITQLGMTQDEVELLLAPVRVDPLQWFFQLAEDETYFPHEHVQAFMDRLTSAGHRADSRVVPGTKHGYVYRVFDTPAGAACAAELLDTVEKAF
ncbi:alpha/beta hydrolase [Propionibacteriaceae bacterium Y1685]